MRALKSSTLFALRTITVINRWDGREAWLDAMILDEMYNTSELFNSANITVPWIGKGGKITHWKAVFINPSVKQKGNDNTCTYSIKLNIHNIH